MAVMALEAAVHVFDSLEFKILLQTPFNSDLYCQLDQESFGSKATCHNARGLFSMNWQPSNN
jgi:hypothetical protein